MGTADVTVLFLTTRGRPAAEQAWALVRQAFPDVLRVQLARAEQPEAAVRTWEGDWLLSFLCPWVVPPALLQRARKGALNFHPGPPAYAGTGCTNFALYDGVSAYGVTCHHMAPAVDTGPIVAVRHVPIRPGETVASLTARCELHLLALFDEALGWLRDDPPMPAAPRYMWGPARTRADLEALARVTPAMNAEEVARRVRALTYPGMPGAYVEVGGVRFEARR